MYVLTKSSFAVLVTYDRDSSDFGSASQEIFQLRANCRTILLTIFSDYRYAALQKKKKL